MVEKENNLNFFKALLFLLIKTLIPSIVILGVISWIVWVCFISVKAGINWLLIIDVIISCFSLYLLPKLGELINTGFYDGIMSFNYNKIELYIENNGNGEYKVEKKESSNFLGKMLSIFISVILLSIFALLLFIINLFRIIFSKKIRLFYSMKYYEIKNDLDKSFLCFCIVVVTIILFLTIIIIKIQTINKIKIF